ncbi:DUF6264 family protein [Diaminobutyricimonas sp. TR449]|uniref:DUF6264 family protein n=1 Tax=Diaminobutyricimonas sp. TR449 TaxID=2708076 RepID=UPI00141DCD9B|nr:DUF6264 family protein [Diaminobutyricimonas sp. TR449]
MTDATPERPQYGAYATPEQQALARGTELPPPEVMSPAAVPPIEASKSRRGDRIAAVALLACGFINVVTGIPGWLRLPASLQAAYDQLGVGEFQAVELASALGIAALITQIVLWLGALGITVALIRAGRLSWWVPLTAGVIAVVGTSVLIGIAIMADPGFAASLTTTP